MKHKHPDEVTSYEFLKEHLYDRPHSDRYENSFRELRPYLFKFRVFDSLAVMLDFLKNQPPETRQLFKPDLFNLDKSKPWLRPAIVEMLMFILWDDLVLKYGRDEGFAEGYWDLMMALEDNRIKRIEQI
jgi:hypothetical protein